MDAAVFDIGILDLENNASDFPGAKEKGKTMPPSSDDLDDANRLSVWCFKQQKELLINDYRKEYKKYIQVLPDPRVGELPESIIYVPMVHKGEAIGVITAQSFRKHAYTNYHVNILRNCSLHGDCPGQCQSLQTTGQHVAELAIDPGTAGDTEKLASLGALTTGIADEIKNPLNFVNNFAELSVELVDELHEELLVKKGNKKSASGSISWHGESRSSGYQPGIPQRHVQWFLCRL